VIGLLCLLRYVFASRIKFAAQSVTLNLKNVDTEVKTATPAKRIENGKITETRFCQSTCDAKKLQKFML